MMPSTRFQKSTEIFEAAVRLPDDELSTFLDTACGGDESLRREVESLLAHDRSAESGFLTPNAELGADRQDEADSLIGQRIGRFTIDERIASGGMGTVYAGTQLHPQRKVAIKVLKSWAWAPSARKRFEFETQMLARLNHPNIAQIFDAGAFQVRGTNQELPYFAMEFVPDAKQITDYARDKGLSNKQFVELMAQVCDAIHYGHQRGVIHRDIKPANILVGSDGRPRVIDFGVARSTHSDIALTTVQTDVGQVIGTLQYMSPEQCNADPLGIDVRSDVYSLGVVLYELLCGRLPYDVSDTTITQGARVICEKEPVRPSKVRPKVRGDIEVVVLTALQKDRERRYQSASDLGHDLRQWLKREPIRARPPGFWHRFTNSMRRHPLATTALSAVCIALSIVGGTLYASMKAKRTPLKFVHPDGARRLDLLALDGSILKSWVAPFRSVTVCGALFDTQLDGIRTKLAVIGNSFDFGDGRQRSICAFNAGRGDYENPVWCSSIVPADLPNDPSRDFQAGNFFAQRVRAYEIFEDVPGEEIVVTFAHEYSRRAIRIYSSNGELLYQVWYNGAINDLFVMPDSRFLILVGMNGKAAWSERGHPEVKNYPWNPIVVFALRVKQGEIQNRYVCTDGEPDCVAPVWYKALLPEKYFDQIKSLAIQAPEQSRNTAKYARLLISFRCDACPVGAFAGWTINEKGEAVPNSWHRNDSYLRYRDTLPPIEDFYLGELPAIVGK